ncbi:nucleotidyltransferase family protein [Emcibacter sp.]|uniref:nucleotidyltransferase domain-containing protein n=1 Tax=Emcibacter sp. TaxID=1979954 RepID=UPI002AA65B1A|nr:nucleotidyltransferase family protein [Emcibacter sp.]
MTETSGSLVIDVLKSPDLMPDFTVDQWNSLLYEARVNSLTGRLAAEARKHDLWDSLPGRVQDIFLSAEIDAQSRQRRLMWELNRIRRALFGFEGPIVVLKGGAYIARKLEAAAGRVSSDVDIMVDRNDLPAVEEKLLEHGWVHSVEDDYDQRYYREWAHELPPLFHPDRGMTVDVHHTILPLTSRLGVDASMLLDDIEQVDGNLYTLSPEDMLLHSAVHLFHDGEIAVSLRNLLEEHDMIREFSRTEGFWNRLMARADELALGRPLYYCLRYCSMILETEIPAAVLAESARYAPNSFVRGMMDWMVPLVTYPPKNRLFQLVSKILYMRSHWLRMPAGLLIRHLTTKFFRRFKGEAA